MILQNLSDFSKNWQVGWDFDARFGEVLVSGKAFGGLLGLVVWIIFEGLAETIVARGAGEGGFEVADATGEVDGFGVGTIGFEN